jgi:hypothetical protein
MLYVKNSSGEFVKPPRPIVDAFESRLSKVKQHFKITTKPVAPLTKEQFLGTYVGRKLAIYEGAFDSLSKKPFEKKDSHVKWFMKAEKVLFSSKKEPVPRGISPRSPRYNAHLGPFVKRIEKVVYKSIADLFGGVTVFKGLNAFERGRHLRSMWEEFDDPVAIGLDASRFDQHVSVQALRWEHEIYKMYFPGNTHLKHLLNLQLRNRFTAYLPEGVIKFETDGIRCSGDMNTSLGNCLLMSAMVYSYTVERVRKFRLANDGDDCVLVVERKELDKLHDLESWFLDMGFSMKREPHVDVFEEIEFCQCHPVFDGTNYVMLRNPKTSIAKDCVSIHHLPTDRALKAWMKSVGQCGMSLVGGFPVVQEFYARFTREGGDVAPWSGDGTPSGRYFLSRNMSRTYSTVTTAARVSFWRAFGICPNNQLLLEQTFREQELDLSARSVNNIRPQELALIC